MEPLVCPTCFDQAKMLTPCSRCATPNHTKCMSRLHKAYVCISCRQQVPEASSRGGRSTVKPRSSTARDLTNTSMRTPTCDNTSLRSGKSARNSVYGEQRTTIGEKRRGSDSSHLQRVGSSGAAAAVAKAARSTSADAGAAVVSGGSGKGSDSSISLSTTATAGGALSLNAATVLGGERDKESVRLLSPCVDDCGALHREKFLEQAALTVPSVGISSSTPPSSSSTAFSGSVTAPEGGVCKLAS